MTKSPAWAGLKKHDRVLLLAAGLVFLVTATVLAVREINLGIEYVLGALAVLGALVSFGTRIRILRAGGVLITLGGAMVAAIMYLLRLELLMPGYLVAPVILLVLSLTWLIRVERQGPPDHQNLVDRFFHGLIWVGFVFGLIVASWACYYQYITHGLSPGFHLRRLVLTAFWLVSGLGLYLGGRVREHDVMLTSGIVVVVLALLKAVFYDTTHLSGFERILALASTGGILTAASFYLRRHLSAPREEPVPRSPNREAEAC